LDVSRILIIKPSSLGDVIQAMPVAWAVRDLYPKARLDWLVMPGCDGVLEGLPPLDRLLLFDRRLYGQMWRSPRSLVSFGWFLSKLRAGRYHLVLDLQCLFRSGFLAWASGAKLRLGLSDAREGAERFYNRLVQVPAEPMSSVDRYMLMAEALGTPHNAPRRFGIHIPEAHRAEAAQLIQEQVAQQQATGGRPQTAGAAVGDPRAAAGKYVVLVPGARWVTKRWPEERFASVAQRISEKLGLAPVVVGAPGDREIADRMQRMRSGRMVDLVGRTSLKTLAAVIDGAECVITGDTGPMHLAAALGRPLVALFGPTSANLTGPYGTRSIVLADQSDCARCGQRSCTWAGGKQELACLRNISVDDVLSAVQRLLTSPAETARGQAAPSPGGSR
jgi:lipopolysaccharide heptosyltransferase I